MIKLIFTFMMIGHPALAQTNPPPIVTAEGMAGAFTLQNGQVCDLTEADRNVTTRNAEIAADENASKQCVNGGSFRYANRTVDYTITNQCKVRGSYLVVLAQAKYACQADPATAKNLAIAEPILICRRAVTDPKGTQYGLRLCKRTRDGSLFLRVINVNGVQPVQKISLGDGKMLDVGRYEYKVGDFTLDIFWDSVGVEPHSTGSSFYYGSSSTPCFNGGEGTGPGDCE